MITIVPISEITNKNEQFQAILSGQTHTDYHTTMEIIRNAGIDPFICDQYREEEFVLLLNSGQILQKDFLFIYGL